MGQYLKDGPWQHQHYISSSCGQNQAVSCGSLCCQEFRDLSIVKLFATTMFSLHISPYCTGLGFVVCLQSLKPLLPVTHTPFSTKNRHPRLFSHSWRHRRHANEKVDLASLAGFCDPTKLHLGPSSNQGFRGLINFDDALTCGEIETGQNAVASLYDNRYHCLQPWPRESGWRRCLAFCGPPSNWWSC